MTNGIAELSVSDDLPDLDGVLLDGEVALLATHLEEILLAIMGRADDDQGGAIRTGEHGQAG